MNIVEKTDAFVRDIINKYALPLRVMAASIVGEDDADDVIQIMYIEITKRIDLLINLSERSLKSYLVSIVKTRSISYLEKKDRHLDRSVDINDIMYDSPSDENVEDFVINKMDYEKSGEVLMKVGDKYRTVFILKHFHMKSNSEIADEVGLSKDSVRTYATRARNKFIELAKEAGLIER